MLMLLWFWCLTGAAQSDTTASWQKAIDQLASNKLITPRAQQAFIETMTEVCASGYDEAPAANKEINHKLMVLDLLYQAYAFEFYLRMQDSLSEAHLETVDSLPQAYYMLEPTSQITEAQLSPSLVPAYVWLPDEQHLYNPELALVPPERSVLGKTWSSTLAALDGLQLCSQVAMDSAHATARKKSLEFLLLRKILIVDYERAAYPAKKAKQKAFIDSLHYVGLVTASACTELKDSYEPFELHSLTEIFAHCPQATGVQTISATTQYGAFHQALLERISGLFPAISISDAHPNLDTVAYGKDFISIFGTFSLRANQCAYNIRLRLADCFWDDSTNTWININQIPNEIPHFFNRIQLDAAANTQLIQLHDYHRRPFKAQEVFVNATQEQLAFLQRHSYTVDYESILHFPVHSTRDIDAMLDGLAAMHLAVDLQPNLRAQIHSNVITGLADILIELPQVAVPFEWEYYNVTTPYQELTRALAAASRGAFAPQNIVDQSEKAWRQQKKKVKFGFELNGKKYKTNLTFHYDWLDSGFLDLIDQACQEQGLALKVVSCHSMLHGSFLLMISPAQEAALLKLDAHLFGAWD